MAAKPLDIHPAALEEAKAAVSWYYQQSESAAINFVAELDRAVELIADSPSRWPRGDLETRRFVLQRFPYVLIYRERKADVQIVAVAHGRRRPFYWTKRLRS